MLFFSTFELGAVFGFIWSRKPVPVEFVVLLVNDWGAWTWWTGDCGVVAIWWFDGDSGALTWRTGDDGGLASSLTHSGTSLFTGFWAIHRGVGDLLAWTKRCCCCCCKCCCRGGDSCCCFWRFIDRFSCGTGGIYKDPTWDCEKRDLI